MARQLRIAFPGAIYHVTCRMIGDGDLNQSRLFVDDKDRERFVVCMADRVEQYNIRLYMFVCMINHFHLVFETPEGNCSKFIQAFSTAYTVYYNLRHHRHGHLLDGRYKAKLVEGDEYLLALSRYVHLNPVRVGVIKDLPIRARVKYLREYFWSTYQSYIGARKTWGFVEHTPILAEMSGKRRDWPRRYREFVETGLAETDADFKMVMQESSRCMGGEGFRAWVDELYRGMVEHGRRLEDAALRRITTPLTAEAVLSVLAEVLEVSVGEFQHRCRDSVLRGMAGRFLIRYAGLTQREAGVKLGGMSGDAASHQIRKVRELLVADRRLRKLVECATERLDKLRQSMSKPQQLRDVK